MKYAIYTFAGALQNVPWEEDQPDSYHQCLGHKINNDFPLRHQNAVYRPFEHPRWGLINQVHYQYLKDWQEVRNTLPSQAKSNKFIPKGQEIFTNYGYTPRDFPGDFLWYREAEAQYLAELESDSFSSEQL